ncbi:MAG: LamG domain-containing protein [Lentisphaeria bacterium]|nr:MAG: LamG domain-containing protein [Lentisphaeria bacterium]
MQISKLSILSAVLPLFLSATEPVLYMPMDGSADILGKDGKKAVRRNRSRRGGVSAGRDRSGAGCETPCLRSGDGGHLHPAAGTRYRRRHDLLLVQAALEGDRSEAYPIITGRDDAWKFRFYLLKLKNGTIELSVCVPGQVQILKKNLFKQEEWHHVAFTWSRDKNEARLYINGKMVGNRIRPGAYQQLPLRKFNIFCGKENTDRFKAEVGNGLYDEIKYFDRALDDAEIFKLASGGKEEKKVSLSLNPAWKEGNRLAFAFRYPEARLPGPKQLLVLNGTEAKKKLLFPPWEPPAELL